MKRGSGLLLVLALLAWLPAGAGSREAVWAAGLALLAAVVLAARARGEWREMPGWVWLAGFVVVLAPLWSWVLAGWLEPGWLERLDREDPVPGRTAARWPLMAESWALGVLAVCWVWVVAAFPLDRSLRRSGLRWVAAWGLLLVVVGCVDMGMEGGWLGWWGFASGGPFANRNQFGLVAAVCAVVCLALAWEDGARGRAGALGWGVGGLLGIAALVLIGSRGAFVGGLVGLCAVGAARWSRRPGALGPVAGLISMVMVLGLAVTVVAHRPLARWFDGEGWSGDARWKLFQDVGRMIQEQPWTGVGLAGFEVIFPKYREVLDAPAPVIHPESDWLWWSAEVGVVWVVVLGLMVVLGLWGERRQGDTLLFSAAAGVTAAALTQGAVDVGLHRPGSFLPVLLVLALWAGQLRGGERMAYPGPFRVMSLGGGLVAGVWLIAAGAGWIPGERWVAQAARDAGSERLGREAALARAEAGLRWAPLDPVLNFRAGWLLGTQGEAGVRGRLLLERARRWAPHDRGMGFESGRLWLEDDPRWALAAWEETLRRSSGNTLDEWFGRMERVTQGRPGLRQGLYFRLAELPGLEYVRLELASPAEAEGILEEILAGGAEAWEDRPLAQQRLLAAWLAREGPARVAGSLRMNHRFEDLFWSGVAREWAKSQPGLGAAYALEMLDQRRGSLGAPSLEEVRSDRARWRSDPGAGEAALRVALAERAAGNPEGALEILAEVGGGGEAARVRAAALLELGRGGEAWQAIRSLVEAGGEG
ncbi:MAG: O-antigen ligase family protein [Verrucomicrobiia bacterium]